MDLLKQITSVVFFFLSFFCGVALFAVTLIAHEKRQDQSFWGGGKIINGWWLIFPYGENGIQPDQQGLVKTARLAWFGVWIFGSLAYWLAHHES